MNVVRSNMTSRCLLLCFILFGLALSFQDDSDYTVIAKTELGEWKGLEDKHTITFLGVPYAQAPVGENRWKKPISNEGYFSPTFKDSFTRTRDICVQINSGFIATGFSQSEDCLTLNMWIPKKAFNRHTGQFNEDGLDVMVFIHGGGFTIGSSYDKYIKGDEFTKRDVILIAMNYRLSIFGFLALEELREEHPQNFNFGLLDQRAALGWVRKNIHHFGGNPEKVTLFGESAGAMSVVWQLTSKDEDLEPIQRLDHLHGAIIQSNADVPYLDCNTGAVSQRENFERRNVCTGKVGSELVSCLRQLDAQKLLNMVVTFPESRKVFFHSSAPNSTYMQPCYGSQVYTSPPALAFRNGQFNRNAKIIIGTTHDEGTMFTFLSFIFYNHLEEESLRNMVSGAFADDDNDDDAAHLLDYYLGEQFANRTHSDTLAEIVNDATFQCITLDIAKHISAVQPETYRYVFMHLPNDGMQNLKIYHSAELPFVFHSNPPGGFYPSTFTEEEETLSQIMIEYWTSFAKTGKPTSPHAIDWPTFSADNPATLEITTTPKVITSYRDEVCALWSRIYPEGVPFLGYFDEMIYESKMSYYVNKIGVLVFFNAKAVGFSVVGLLLAIVFLSCKCCRKTDKKKVKTQ